MQKATNANKSRTSHVSKHRSPSHLAQITTAPPRRKAPPLGRHLSFQQVESWEMDHHQQEKGLDTQCPTPLSPEHLDRMLENSDLGPPMNGGASLLMVEPIVTSTQTGSPTFHPDITCVKVGAFGIGTTTAVVIWFTDLLAPLDLRDCLVTITLELSPFWVLLPEDLRGDAS